MNLTSLVSISPAWRTLLETQLTPRETICQLSLSPISAMDTLYLLRTRLVTDLISCRLPFNESFAGMRRVIRQAPTVMASFPPDSGPPPGAEAAGPAGLRGRSAPGNGPSFPAGPDARARLPGRPPPRARGPCGWPPRGPRSDRTRTRLNARH